MPLTVTLEISDAELDYFRSVMSRVREDAGTRLPHEVAVAAAAEVARLRASARSPFVARRIDRVDKLIAMLEDAEWALPDDDRLRVLDALDYVADAGCASCSSDLEALARVAPAGARVVVAADDPNRDEALRRILSLYRRSWPPVNGARLGEALPAHAGPLLAPGHSARRRIPRRPGRRGDLPGRPVGFLLGRYR